jgi:uncharacterized protein (DUF2147 family)
MRLILLVYGLFCGGCLAAGGAAAADPTGVWITEKGKAKIEIAECGGALCGRIVWLSQPNDPKTGEPLRDSKNREEGKRLQPLLGVEIVKDMKPSVEPARWSGRVYNPEDGGTYTAHLIMKSDNTLRLEGCMMIICSGESWKRDETMTGSVPAGSQQSSGKPNARRPDDSKTR